MDSLSLARCLTGSNQRINAETETLIPCRGGFFDVGYSTSGVGYWREGIGALRARAQDSHENLALHTTQRVRRLTPRECERLQGFTDDYTAIPMPNGKPTPDGPRYKALGNSMAVPVMNWIGRRIELVESEL